MSGRIPQTFIDDLLARIDIVELINHRVPLTKSGREFKACCPFHGEKTPSFYVSPNKQFYHCFGCGVHGNAIGFLLEYDRMHYRDAIEELARQVGVDVPSTGPAQDDGVSQLYPVLDAAANWYRRQLRANPHAVEYCKGRGITGATAQLFGIGFAPPGWDGLINGIGGQHNTFLLDKAGLINQRDSGQTYDRFRDRLIFPIRDVRGRTIAFGGRVLGDGEPKYLNSPETPAFHKGRELYGLFEAREAQRQPEMLMVVEGYMDVVMLAQHGLHNVVATLGTATTQPHLEKLFRIVSTVVFCFDGDKAGRRAAWRALENALPAVRDEREIRFLFLPDGEDPDSLVQRIGADAFKQLTAKAVPLSEFLLNGVCNGVDVDTMDGRAVMAERARKQIVKIPTGVYRSMVVDALAKRVNMTAERVTGWFETDDSQQTSLPVKAPTQPVKKTIVRYAITLLLQHAELALQVEQPAELADAQLLGSQLLCDLIVHIQQRPELRGANIIEKWRDQPEHKPLEQLLMSELNLDPETVPEVFTDTLKKIAYEIVELQYDRLIQKPSLEPAEKALFMELSAKLLAK